MFKKCENCYKDNKEPSVKDCRKCGDKQHKYEKALIKIRQLLSDALDFDKTSTTESFDKLYDALELCDILDE